MYLTVDNFFVKMKAYFFIQNLVKAQKQKRWNWFHGKKLNASKEWNSCGILSTYKIFREINFFIREGFELNHNENWLHKIFQFLSYRRQWIFVFPHHKITFIHYVFRQGVRSILCTLIEIFVKWNILHSSYLFWVDLIVQLEH